MRSLSYSKQYSDRAVIAMVGDGRIHFLCGTPGALARSLDECYDELWIHDSPTEVSRVIALAMPIVEAIFLVGLGGEWAEAAHLLVNHGYNVNRRYASLQPDGSTVSRPLEGPT